MSTSVPDDAVIFISYRRSDAGWPADHLAAELRRTFGDDRVFLDTRSIQAGDEFGQVIEGHLRRASVLAVVIGPDWLFARDEFGRRRLDNTTDWVRTEIRAAIESACAVIPVLIDDATLPNAPEALPPDIAPILGYQRIQIRQATSAADVEALCRALEARGFRRLGGARGAAAAEHFNDAHVAEVMDVLNEMLRDRQADVVPWPDLIGELDRLFNRKTFRFETLRTCPEQRWADRLDSAYQTERALQRWERNARAVAPSKADYRSYVELMREVGSYAMQMGTLLFRPQVDFNQIEHHIGKPSFKSHLPEQIEFERDVQRQPIIPDEVNEPIERHRLAAIERMDMLAAT